MPSPKRTRLALLLSVTLPLAACGMIPSGGTDLPPEVDPSKVACEAFRVIFYSSNDTPETRTQAQGHNASYCAICSAYEPRCPKPGGA